MFYAISFEPNQDVIHSFDTKSGRSAWINNQVDYTRPRIARYREAASVCKRNLIERTGEAFCNAKDNIEHEAVNHQP